ncbi:hypothetical protein [Polyangium aurulentum]|uniref:hypothetical protein n=1 Tax=Polyangium aurulentum TaxID=2567896 RepID=UPI0010AEA3DC|nr:hypothetical protein [Polyangium aurulentum]UQA63044.1 hypothetical protein E8A73_022315 [Polyangium aurulentum]
MKRREIDALVRAHRDRPRAVAFLHVLRQPALEDDDHAFLAEAAGELTAPDLLRWRARSGPDKRSLILSHLARMAVDSPAQFEHEVLNAPGMSFEAEEWEKLAELTRGKVPAPLQGRIERREARPPAPSPSGVALFDAAADEGPVDLASMFDLDDGGAIGGRDASGPAASADDSLGGGLSLGDELGLDFGGDLGGEGDPLFADPYAGLTTESGLEKARTSTSGEERAMLLEWLEGQGVARGTLLAIALEGLRTGPVASPLVGWVGKKLSSREAWQEHGGALFSALVERRAFAEMQELLAQGLNGLAQPALAALANALIDRAHTAIGSRDVAGAGAVLSGLMCLDVGDAQKERYRALAEAAREAQVSEDVVVLVELLLRQAKQNAPRGETLEGMVASVHALSDALA